MKRQKPRNGWIVLFNISILNQKNILSHLLSATQSPSLIFCLKKRPAAGLSCTNIFILKVRHESWNGDCLVLTFDSATMSCVKTMYFSFAGDSKALTRFLQFQLSVVIQPTVKRVMFFHTSLFFLTGRWIDFRRGWQLRITRITGLKRHSPRMWWQRLTFKRNIWRFPLAVFSPGSKFGFQVLFWHRKSGSFLFLFPSTIHFQTPKTMQSESQSHHRLPKTSPTTTFPVPSITNPCSLSSITSLSYWTILKIQNTTENHVRESNFVTTEHFWERLYKKL